MEVFIWSKFASQFLTNLTGSLYLLLGRQGKSLMVRRDWESLNMVWPALIASQHSEKPSIIRLMNALSDTVYYYMELFTIYQQVGFFSLVLEPAHLFVHLFYTRLGSPVKKSLLWHGVQCVLYLDKRLKIQRRGTLSSHFVFIQSPSSFQSNNFPSIPVTI